jgi:hypothetical protein
LALAELAGTTVAAVAFVGTFRYRVGHIDPILSLFFAVGASTIWSRAMAAWSRAA